MKRRILPFKITLLATLLAGGAAHAQDTPAVDTIPVETQEEQAATPTPSSASQAQRLEEVVVTATKRAQSERDVPMSIDSMKAKDLEKQGATGLEQILQYSPGVSINKGNGPDSNYVSIRGVSSDSRNNIYSRPTGIFLDDSNLSNPSTLSVLADVDPWDLSRVEVLKGPQGTLFGGSALSGAIRYLANAPELSGVHFKLQAGGGSMASSEDLAKSYAAMFNLPLGDTLGLRLNGIHRETPGFIDDTASGEKDINPSKVDQGRAALLWQPISALTLQGSFFRRTVDAPNGGIIDNVEDRSTDVRRATSYTKSKIGLADFRAEWDMDFARLVGLYSRLSIDGVNQTDLTPSLGLDSTPVKAYQPYVSTVEQPSYELRLVSSEPLWGFDYLVGLYYMQSQQALTTQTTVDALAPLGPLVPTATLNLLQQLANRLGVGLSTLRTVSSDVIINADATEKALFFDLSRKFFDDFTVNLGGRYYDQVTDGVSKGAVNGYQYADAIPVLPLPPPLNVLEDVQIYQPEKGFNPKLALTWKPSRDFSVYASASKGFRFGGINTVTGLYSTALDIPASFKSDHLWNYEAGVRTDWFDGRLTADFTAFLIDWTDMQILQLKAGAFGYTDNVGGARSKGVEADFKALLPGSVFVSLGGAYVDARTTEPFQDANGDVPAGAPLPATPKYSASGIIGWNGEILGINVQPGYSVTYKSSSPNTLVNDIPLSTMVLHNASVNFGLRQFELQPEINLSVTNLFDKAYTSFALNTLGTPASITNQPRTILLTLSLSY